ncbi:pyruvate phosphate dikinase PEP/pyruvate-binding protein [Synechococcales cyanobacterium C]|uniref:Pyruvate phosphate dikinase PEP/pyruvate-binding protein n=1 Tax=Petrachloros mirabilis ULC683 TaxID=2781853 RepID=A0A8K1ZX13_9CYAN|nr:glycerol-3-phosphate acyltransferase [Petrachloros mirabilis]NCJ05227.1 pyruvate phosphate dikinase PEP/pyruvate-binding protein [Petrachloros mirabilis ULC683]
MMYAQVWGALLLLVGCFGIGGLPITGWLTQLLTGKRLAELGTGNVGVSAAFYHGGSVIGILAVLFEAAKGIAAVLAARGVFPADATWQLVALIALVAGRYWLGRGAGTTNVAWGIVVYSWQVALAVFVIGGVSFTLVRERQRGRHLVLLLLPMTIALLRQDVPETLAAIALSALMAWIYQQIPDDLALSPQQAQADSQPMFQFFRGDRTLLSLDQALEARKVGAKAATLAQLKQWGYSVPQGWVLPPGDDAEPLIMTLEPSPQNPLVVRSSAIGEDAEGASAAGQYQTFLGVQSRAILREAIADCQDAYSQFHAVQYRQDRGVAEGGMAILVQHQIDGIFSGVAFSRDPLAGDENWVAVECLPGAASLVVSGQVTPEQYRVRFPEGGDAVHTEDLIVEGQTGVVPRSLVQQAAHLARELESRYHGLPQDVEWTYDGHTLWLLQARPITTLQPIWTRKIAAEVIPGVIHPLTWSVNQPLTCGAWGDLFTLVLANRAQGLNFRETATLHYSRAYFNATLLGDIFRRMGLPPESLEFLTRGASISRPSLGSTLRNIPGLWRLVRREWRLDNDFDQADQTHFQPLLQQLADQSLSTLSPEQVLTQIDTLLTVLKKATYFSILAPLSAALRQAILKVPDAALETGVLPETQALRSLQNLAAACRNLLGDQQTHPHWTAAQLFATLEELPDGDSILAQLEQFLDQYGHLSEVATDIAVPTWREDPHPVRELLAQLVSHPSPPTPAVLGQTWQVQQVQARLSLKGKVATVYNQLLAHLRVHVLSIEKNWLAAHQLQTPGDIFFLKLREVRGGVAEPQGLLALGSVIAERRSQFGQDQALTQVPFVIYGTPPPRHTLSRQPQLDTAHRQGIAASPGALEGRVKVLKSLRDLSGEIDRTTILVVPYTDAGWAPLLARAGGIIAEVGGRLSHGAIVAREYGIPAVMDIPHATEWLRDGQRVYLDGNLGTVSMLEPEG